VLGRSVLHPAPITAGNPNALLTFPQKLLQVTFGVQDSDNLQRICQPVDHQVRIRKGPKQQYRKAGQVLALVSQPRILRQNGKDIEQFGFQLIRKRNARFTSQITPDLENLAPAVKRDKRSSRLTIAKPGGLAPLQPCTCFFP
jgi:hypothetical protein